MARKFRKKKRLNTKGEPFYQIFGPDPKTGKDRYWETVKGGGNIAKRADDRVRDLTVAMFNLESETAKRETRTVADLAKAWLNKECQARCQWTIEHNAWHDERHFSPATLESYERSVEYFLQDLGPIVLISLDRDDLQAMVERIKREHGPSSGRAAGIAAKAMIRWGADNDWTMRPKLISGLSRLRLPPKSERKAIPADADVRACLAVVFGPCGRKVTKRGYLHARWIWLLMLANGPRRAEIAALGWDDLDPANSVGRIKDSHCKFLGRSKDPKSRAGKRPLYIPKQAHEVLEAIRELDGGSSGLVLKPVQGSSAYSAMDRNMQRVMDVARIPKERRRGIFHIHGMRAWQTSHLHQRNVPEQTRKLLIGHSRSGGDVTAGYTHVVDGALISAFAKAQQLVDDFMPAVITPLSEVRDWKERKREYERERQREYRKTDKYREKQRQYNERTREHRLEYGRQYSKEHRGQRREYLRQYKKKHPERIREAGRKYYLENRERLREKQRQYYLENREQFLERARQHYRQRLADTERTDESQDTDIAT